jgi:hypothetical protein
MQEMKEITGLLRFDSNGVSVLNQVKQRMDAPKTGLAKEYS